MLETKTFTGITQAELETLRVKFAANLQTTDGLNYTLQDGHLAKLSAVYDPKASSLLVTIISKSMFIPSAVIWAELAKYLVATPAPVAGTEEL